MMRASQSGSNWPRFCAVRFSDGTVKRAISQLRAEGLVETVIGRGVYVIGNPAGSEGQLRQTGHSGRTLR